jgi:hypothetical protein
MIAVVEAVYRDDAPLITPCPALHFLAIRRHSPERR